MNKKISEIIERAIYIEDKMHQFYLKMSERQENEEARDALILLANEELEHKKFLEECLEKGKFPPVQISNEVDNKPLVEKVTAISEDISILEALAFAIRSEEFQHRFYEKMALSYPDGITRALVLRLAAMELGHKEKIEKMFKLFSQLERNDQ